MSEKEMSGKIENEGENTGKSRIIDHMINKNEARRCIDSFIAARERMRDLEMLHSLLMSKSANPDSGDKRLLEDFNRSTNVIDGKIGDLEKRIIVLLLREKE